MQVRADCPGKIEEWHRHISKGGWTFSTQDHGWVVSDCTAEALKVFLLSRLPKSDLLRQPPCQFCSSLSCSCKLTKLDRFFWFQACLIVSKLPDSVVGEKIPDERIFDAVNLILSYKVSSCTNYCYVAASSFVAPQESLELPRCMSNFFLRGHIARSLQVSVFLFTES